MSRRQASVRVTIQPVHPDIREMQAAEKALQESYNSLSRHLRAHRPCQDESLAPNYGSILYKMWSQKKLTRQQLEGWQRFWGGVTKEYEASNSLVASMDGSASAGNYPSRELQRSKVGPAARLTKEGEQARAAWHSLRVHERGLLEQMMRDAWHVEGYKEVHRHSVDYLGGILSGYADNRQKIAAGISAIQRMLTSLAEHYGIQPFEGN